MILELPAIGKLDQCSFSQIIYPRLGEKNPRILLGPRHGVDAAVIDLGNQVLVVAEDPTFGMPALLPYFGWSIVHIAASDVAVLGVKPEYLTICLLLPPGSSPSLLEEIWEQIHQECA
ncbi:MAG: AIR synthase, partial [Clostridia bacterium]|nr:AIR synthase [Clostridia bacterium]